MNSMKGIGVMAILAMMTGTNGFADEQYVTDVEADAILHATEEAWNSTYGAAEGNVDGSGFFPAFSDSATSTDGSVTVKFECDGGTYEVDYGPLDFSAHDPIEASTCEFEVSVYDVWVTTSGTITVKTTKGSRTYTCNDVRLGLRDFSVVGDVTLSESTMSFSGVATDISSSDYYWTLSCGASGAKATASADDASRLSRSYKKLLQKKLAKPNSNFSKTAKNVITGQSQESIESLAQ
ncbi:MAG: hypothetical protein HYX75_10765 [Acidobacteria bacterium]|nr:hypothetical protein [Acidobacteriota bacterium]